MQGGGGGVQEVKRHLGGWGVGGCGVGASLIGGGGPYSSRLQRGGGWGDPDQGYSYW